MSEADIVSSVKPFFGPYNQSNVHVAFFFNALYSALIYSIGFRFTNAFDDYIQNHPNNYSYEFQLVAHSIVTFLFTILVTYVLWYGFGWGKCTFG